MPIKNNRAGTDWFHPAATMSITENSQDILDMLPISVMVVSLDRNVLYANREALNVLGLPSIEVIGCSLCKLSKKSVWLDTDWDSQLRFEGGAHSIMVEDAKASSLQMFWQIARTDATPKQSGSFILTGVFEKVPDVDLHQLVKHLPGYLYWKDTDRVYRGCNNNFAHVAGLEKSEDIVGKTDFDLAWGETEAEIFREGDMKTLQGVPQLDFEEPQLQADGRQATVLASKVPLLNKRGKVSGLIGIYQDITERKEMEGKLREMNDSLTQANDAKAAFIRNMSHDFRTPLSGLVGVGGLIRATTCQSEVKEYAEDMIASVDALQKLTASLLDAGSLEQGHYQETQSVFEIPIFAKQLLQLFALPAGQKGINLNIDFDRKDVPKYGCADHFAWFRILVNLIGNALKFTEVGHVNVSMRSISSGAKHWIQWQVQDSGIGMLKEDIPKIFESFTRLSAAHQGCYSGFGCGLSIVKQYVDALGGKVWVESVLGKGSTFYCKLPYTEVTPAMQAQYVAGQVQDESLDQFNLSLSKASAVLLLEDNVIAAKVARKLLLQYYERVDIAKSGANALELFEQHHYEIVYVDVGLPDMSGQKVAQMIRQYEQKTQRKSVPLIALTAHVTPEDEASCLDMGMNMVLRKPLQDVDARRMIIAYSRQNLVRSAQEHQIDSVPSIQNMLVDELPRMRSDLDFSYQQEDWTAMVNLVHQLHGAVAYCHASEFQKEVSRLERILREKPISVPAVQTAYRAVCRCMEQFIEKTASRSDAQSKEHE